VHARIGVLRGIEAVYHALTLPNASFTFSPAFEAPEHTINQPWTSVVLEGLRRMDEGVMPGDPFPAGHQAHVEEVRVEEPKVEEAKVVESKPVSTEMVAEDHVQVIPKVKPKFEKPVFTTPAAEMPDMGAFLSQTDTSGRFGSWKLLAVVGALALIVAVIAVPWGWYARGKTAKLTDQGSTAPAQNSQVAAQPTSTNETPAVAVPTDSAAPATSSEAAELAAKHLREARAKERAAKAQETGTTLAQPTPAVVTPSVAKTTQASPPAGSKKATVQVTYDENGRVTQASGGDATALRIARQKRFPAGKAGSATITIPIN
jgi:hypothetical protein